jgi:hypothetical protein
MAFQVLRETFTLKGVQSILRSRCRTIERNNSYSYSSYLVLACSSLLVSSMILPCACVFPAFVRQGLSNNVATASNACNNRRSVRCFLSEENGR